MLISPLCRYTSQVLCLSLIHIYTFTKKVYYSATGRKDVVIILTTGKVHKASGTIGAKNTNLWSGNSIEIDAKEPIANNKATLADFDFYSVFMGNKIVTTVDSKFTDFQPCLLYTSFRIQ